IIGLLFVGRTLAEQGNTLPNCTNEASDRRRDGTEGGTESYCIDKESNKIYNVINREMPLSGGVHVFMNKGESGISEISLTGGASNPIESGKEGELSMYLCDEDNVCKKTEGYIKVTYGTEGQDKKEDYYEIELGSSKKAEEVTDKCDGKGRIGLQSSTYGVCLSVKGESVEFGEEKNYILDGEISQSSIFKSVANSKDGIVLTRDVSKIYFNNIYTDEEFCQYEDKKIIKRKEQFVDGTILNTLYECADGVCDISKVPENVENGNYLVDGIIYNRSGAEIEKLTESGIFAFKQSDPTDITYSNLLSSNDIGELTSNDLGSVYLYDCVNGVCTRTSGFIKYGTSTNGSIALAECTKESGCKTLDSVDCTEETDNSKINLDENNNMKLCVSGSLSTSTYNLIDNTMYETNSNENIIGAKQTGSFFKDSELKVCTDGDCKKLESAAGYYLNSYTNNDDERKKLISCANGSCKLIEPKNGYYINKDSSNSKSAILCDAALDEVSCKETVLATSCTDNANKLVYNNDFKYCHGNFEKDIPSTEETVNLYQVDGVKASGINYPTDFITEESENKMVIQVNQYSVTQYINNDLFCINGDVKKNECVNGDTGIKCDDAKKSCKIFIVGACDLKDINENCDGYYVNESNKLQMCAVDNAENKINCNDVTKIGYFKNDRAKTYIKCITDGSQTQTIKCEELEQLGSTCSSVGDLIKDESDNVKLCVESNNGNAITIFTNEDSKKYFIKASGLNSSITDEQKKHYIVNVAENEVLTETADSEYKKYKYIKSTGTPAILVKGEQKGITTGELVEFTKSNALPECEDEVVLRRDEVFEHTESYCIDKGSKKIYNVNDKLSPLSEGVHVFMNGGDVGISEINLTGGTSNPIESGKEGNLSMYLCDEENVCNQTEGYIKVTYGTKDIESEDYYEIKSDSSKKAEKVTDKCDGNNRIGLQSSTYGVCLSVEGKSVEFAGESGEEENYLLDGTIASGSIFKSVAEGKSGIVLTRDVSKIYFNNIYTDEEFCKYEDKKIIKRKEQFVDGTILNTLYECADGVCDISKVPENVDDGDYLVDGIIYNRSGVKIEQLTESGIFAFKKSDPTDITYSNLLSSDDIGKLTSNDLGSVYLYDCVNGVCIRTPGFIKYGSTAALAECTNEKKCETLESVDCKEGTANGSINLTGTEMKLCVSESLSESTYNSIGTTMYETNSDKNIIGAKQTGNFLSGSKLIVCEDGECTSPDSAAGYYLNSNYEEITAGKKLISCTDANNCELIEPKNGYYINKDSTNSKRAILCDKNGCSETGDLTKENCNSDANKLVYSNGALKYCDDNNVKNIPGDSSTVNLYEVNGVKKSDINYPTDFIANPSTTEKMVIQVDQYSVTPYVDEIIVMDTMLMQVMN
ncbi:hypothetical protein BCR36DRAFT_448852, partial [Piromyces finnis]